MSHFTSKRSKKANVRFNYFNFWLISHMCIVFANPLLSFFNITLLEVVPNKPGQYFLICYVIHQNDHSNCTLWWTIYNKYSCSIKCFHEQPNLAVQMACDLTTLCTFCIHWFDIEVKQRFWVLKSVCKNMYNCESRMRFF